MLYACGSNGKGQLGLNHDEDVDDWTPVPISLAGPLEISGGGNHTIIVEVDSGRALLSQNNCFTEVKHPQLGKWKLASAGWDFYVLVDTHNKVWHSKVGEELSCLFEGPQITRIDSGLSHTVFSTTEGELYGWGASRKGQAGIEAQQVDQPVKFITDHPVSSFACGKDFTALVLQNGKLELRGNSRWFKDLSPLSQVSEVKCGWSTLAVPGIGIWGNNSHGQLDMPKSCNFFVLGSEHGIYVESEGTVKTWGWGEHGNCPGPHQFGSSCRIQLFAGCATSFVYTY